MSDPFHLKRFTDAQDASYPTALAELRSGRKRTHWIWYVFPQLKDLGRSETAKLYGITSLDEARAYLAHPVLGARLEEATRAVMESGAPSLHALFGAPDDMKFRSCMTLFAQASAHVPNLYSEALARWSDGEFDSRTLDLLAA